MFHNLYVVRNKFVKGIYSLNEDGITIQIQKLTKNNGQYKNRTYYLNRIDSLAVDGNKLQTDFPAGIYSSNSRTDNHVKNYFYSTMRRALRRMNKYIGSKNSTAQMRTIRPSILSYLLDIADNDIEIRCI